MRSRQVGGPSGVGRGVVPLVAALALAVSACAASSPGSGGGPPSPGATDPPASPIASDAAVPEALDFSAPALGGGTVRGADYAGEDLALWFWAPW